MSQINGVVIGVVTSVDDPEQQGRVKLHFPWLDDNHETDWTRIAAPMAGGGRGVYFMPEVGDEVLAAFEHGDVRFPFVVGFMWNGQDAPPTDHVRRRCLCSSNRHQIHFIDATPKGGSLGALVIEDAHGNTITLSNGKIVVKAVALLELEASTIVLQGPEGAWRRVVSPNTNPI